MELSVSAFDNLMTGDSDDYRAQLGLIKYFCCDLYETSVLKSV